MMKRTLSIISQLGTVGTTWAISFITVYAQVFDGGDVQSGISQAEAINTGGTADLRTTVESIVQEVLSYMGLAAVIVISIGGIYMVVGGGSDESRQRAQKIIIYTLVGLLVILLSSAFVGFVVNSVSG